MTAGLRAAALAAALALPAGAAPQPLQVWRLGGRDGPARPVGSLQKPFVLEAWARAHPGLRPAAFTCTRASRCWLPAGHGRLELARATAVSCNAYFLELARATPPELLARVLRERGFVVAEPLSAEAAVGLVSLEAPGEVAVAPQALMSAYASLARQPWSEGEGLRQELLAGLREAALTGTASGLGQRGYLAKTGTVPALDGQPLATSGWAVALDEAGFGALALLPRGTGREAARELGTLLPRLRSGGSATAEPEVPRADEVRVRLLEALPRAGLVVRHLEAHPVATSAGFVGPGAQLRLSEGLAASAATWQLLLPRLGFERRVPGRLAQRAGRLVATMTARQWLAGVLQGESPAPDLRLAAAAALLRFLARGPRHADADVCDSTHCAYFVGAGPRLEWSDPRRARPLPDLPPLDDAEWARAQALARQPGPALITSHCGGQPLSELYVWGRGSREAPACPRHPGPAAAWRRSWPAEALARAFGGRVADVRVDDSSGTWQLAVEAAPGRSRLSFDEAHRRLSVALGWDALPSPASRVVRAGPGFEAQGVGRGHRVGLCLDGEPAGPDRPAPARGQAE